MTDLATQNRPGRVRRPRIGSGAGSTRFVPPVPGLTRDLFANKATDAVRGVGTQKEMHHA